MARSADDQPEGPVLLIEDEPLLREALSLLLRVRGYEVAEAGDGDTGLRLVQELRPAVVVFGILMPGLNGFELMRRMKADPDLARIPTLCFTARRGDRNIRALGCSAYIRKPASPGMVVDTIGRLIEQARGRP